MARTTGKRREGASQTGLDPELERRTQDRAAYAALIEQYYERFQPNGPAERCLLDDVIYCDWSIRRCQRFQAQGTSALEWHGLLASKQEAYRTALKTLREYQANPIPGSALSDPSIKVTVH
jgi:hypothetical protein